MRSSITDRLEGIVKFLQTSEVPVSKFAIEKHMTHKKQWTSGEIAASLVNLLNMKKVIRTTADSGEDFYKLHPSQLNHDTKAERERKRRKLSIPNLCKAVDITYQGFSEAKAGYSPVNASKIADYLGLDVRSAFGNRYVDIDAPGVFNPRSYSSEVDKAS